MNRFFILALLICNLSFAGGVNVPDGQAYSVTCADDQIILGNTSAANLPSAALCSGHRIAIKKGDQTAGVASVNPVAGQTIDYMLHLLLPIAGDGFALFSDGANWRSETQTNKGRPYSHRTVTPGAANSSGIWVFDLCHDNAEFVRVDADGSNSGLAVYLGTQGCGGVAYTNTASFWIMNVGTDPSRPVSIWPQGMTINGSAAPIYLVGRYNGVHMYWDGNEFFVLGYTTNAWPQRTWP